MINSKEQQTKFKNPRKDNVIFGNIVLPSDKGLSREDYIDFSHRTGTIAVLEDDGTFHSQVPVAYSFCGVNDGFLYDMDIPEVVGKLGERVVMINFFEQQIPICVGSLKRRDSGFKLDTEKQIRLSKVKMDGDKVASSFEIGGDGLNGVINLLVSSKDAKGGKINLTAINSKGKGEFNFKSNYWKQLITADCFIGIDGAYELIVEKEIKINSNKSILIGDEKKAQKNLKGEDMAQLVSDLASECAKIVVVTAVGNSSPPTNIANLLKLGVKAKTLLSTKTKVE